MRAPAALIALPLLVGSAIGVALGDSADRWLPLGAACGAVLSALSACAWLAEGFTAGVVAAVATGCVLGGLSLGIGAARDVYRPPLLDWFDARPADTRDDPAIVQGRLREDASMSAAGVSMVVDVRCGDFRPCDRSTRAHGRFRMGVRLNVGGVAPAARLGDWRAGREIRVPALLRRPASFGDPGVPNEDRALARRGIALVGSVKSAALVEVTARGGVLDEAAGAARAWARRQLARHVGRWSAESGAIASAILIGDRSGLSEEDERRLQKAGTYHVIAISGGNIAILTALLLFGLGRIGIPPAPSAAAVIALLLFYSEVAGGGASVSRAVAAACVFLAARMLDHRGPPLNALAVAGVAAMAASPLAVFDAGFVLSFGATLGILLGVPRVLGARESRGRGRIRRVTRHAAAAFAGLFAATVCAELALVPASATLFSRVTIAGLILNFVAIPFMTVAQVASLAALGMDPLADAIANACGRVAHLAASGLVGSARLVDVAPWLSVEVARPAWWVIAAYYTSCAAVFASSRRVLRAGACGIGFTAAAIVISPAAASRDHVSPPAPGTLRVVFLDVGQGDATIAILPDGRAMLVDAGGLPGAAFDVGDRVVAPSLRALGVRRLGALVVTHGDPDHIGGAPAALRHFLPRAIWEGVPVPPHARLRDLAALASGALASWRTVQAGDREIAGGVTVTVLHPPPPDWERQRVRNDDSVVLELRIGGVSIVLPGDVGQEGEALVIPRLAPGAVVILKAPHHGSATSSTPAFIQAAHPSAVVFSAGRGNRFGHPAPGVVSRYRQSGALVFRTDEDGAIAADTDGRRVTMSTWSGRRVAIALSAR